MSLETPPTNTNNAPDATASSRSSRTRRRTVKAVDYSKEQQFSDDDIFEDGLRDDKKTPKPNTGAGVGGTTRKARVGRPRKSNIFTDALNFDEDNSGMVNYSAGLSSTPRYTEKGYDPTQLPIREKYLFQPEYELDGSRKIELIVGRRPISEKGSKKDDVEDLDYDDEDGESDDAGDDDDSEKEDVESSPKIKRKRGRPRKNPSPVSKETNTATPILPYKKHIEYEYLVKFKGKSYLHLEWKSASDLESMNKSAKTLYRRFIKKLKAGTDDNLEDPTFDNAYAVPQKILDEKDHTMMIELSDKELIAWEKKRERELADEKSDVEDEKNLELESSIASNSIENESKNSGKGSQTNISETKSEDENEKNASDDGDSEIDIDLDEGDVNERLEKIRKILQKEGPYYPIFENCDNPYRDGYLTHPPKKPRASYLFFQCAFRAQFQRKYKGASQGEIMTLLGDTWRSLSEEQQAPFLQLAKEEADQYEKERVLMEKAQRPNELWQPIRRCRMVLNRLVSDSYSTIFLEPVNLKDFPDYEDAIDQPMDLGTIRKKLDGKKYQAPEIFARDMRKVWNNCKVYNQHGSAIWYVADYMSKQFERLYQAWVLLFRERYLRWINPKARPWELSCRHSDGACGTSDEKMVMCDHCDAMYGMSCLQPRLKKLPKGIWHCPECTKYKHANHGARMLSAIYEQAARKRAELGDIPKKEVKRRMFLVKWAGLGYENCTWELPEDINDDSLIDEYRKLNNMIPDEPKLKIEDVEDVLNKTKHISIDNAKGHTCIPDLRAQLYAQSRAIQFSKFGMPLPHLLSKACGSKSMLHSLEIERCPNHNKEVVSYFDELVSKVIRGENRHTLQISDSLPPLLTGEYDAVIPITEKGLMMNVGEIHGAVSFLGYREFPDGRKGPAELSNLIRNVGDKIISVDGVTTVNKTFQEVIQLLRNTGKNKFAYMRFLEMRYGVCNGNLTSTGDIGQYILDDLFNRFKKHRRIALAKRKQKAVDDEEPKNEDDDSDDSVGTNEVTDDDSDAEESEGDLLADGDDYELVLKERIRQQASPNKSTSSCDQEIATEKNNNDELTEKSNEQSVTSIKDTNGIETSATVTPNLSDVKNNLEPDESAKSSEGSSHEEINVHKALAPSKVQNEDVPSSNVNDATTLQSSEKNLSSVKAENEVTPVTISSTEIPQSKELIKVKSKESISKPNLKKDTIIDHSVENTRSLALRLLDVDVGYSSDEGDYKESAFFVDGVDLSFSTRQEFETKEKTQNAETSGDEDQPTSDSKEQQNANNNAAKDWVPVKQNEFSTLSARTKLSFAAILSKRKPDYEDFDQFPLPSKAALEAEAKEQEAARKAAEKAAENEEKKNADMEKKSTTKVEQLSKINNEVIHIWATAEDACSTLQIPLKQMKQILNGEYNEDLGDEVGGFRWRYADENAVVTRSSITGRDSKKGKQAFLEFRDKLYDHEHPHLYKNNHKLRDYQVDGVNWLASCWYKRHSCILADEMGLGKTVQIVTYVEHIHRVEKIQRPFLIVVPLSTVEHWRREFEGWTDMQCCIYHDRQREWRDVMREYEWYYADRPHTPDYLKFDVLVTTYDTLIGDYDILGQIPWRVTVVDEAHRLRNTKGKLLECMKQISARGTLQYGFQSRVLMTGTPLQNNTQELWTLLNFIEPYKFPSLEDFEKSYGNMANREQVESLQRKISPFMLRRVKEDVAKDIPAKEETLIDVELTSIQKQYYRAIFEHNHSFLSMGTNRATAPKLMNIQMELRKCCNHPFLLDGVETRELEKYHKDLYDTKQLENKTADEQQAMLNEHGYINTSGKMVLLNKLLPKLRQEGHKVLIFSQMVKMLDLISEFCDYKGFRHERLDGRVRGNERQKAIDRFESEDDSFIFLLSTRAGGVGINLTAADICIIFDSDWNPQNDVQAQARCHRIGQTKDVMIYRLITSRTFEQEMFDRASKKLGLEQAVLGTFGQDDDDGKPTSKEMEQLLKKGAYALLDDDNDEIGKEFCEDDIDSILAKRTRTRVVEGAKTSAWLNKSGLNVSKSKFIGEGAAATANVDVDDPLFWQKVMPDFVTPTIMMTKLKDIIKLVEKPNAVNGPGRGRKKKVVVEEKSAEENPPKEKEGANDAKGDTEKADCDESKTTTKKPNNANHHPTRTLLKKAGQFMSDLASMMEGIFEDAEDDNLPQSDKSICQNLLLMVSVKERIFTNEQRMHAKKMLKRLEGDRRRRCRTNVDESGRFTKRSKEIEEEAPNSGTNSIPEELMILSRHKRRQKRLKEKEREKEKESLEEDRKSQRASMSPKDESGYVGEDGYRHHSDSEADWSDVGEDIYRTKKKRGISKKEARRRRAWASDKDPAAAAGRLWPVFPRTVLSKVLKTMLDDVIKNDEEKGGLFSVPVPIDQFPEYYELVKRPMDYGTMRKKLENKEYRSAQAMQKDFLLVMQNCLQFNSPDSDIVKEARKQALRFPSMLRNAAMKHNLFLSEDGSILHVQSEDEDEYNENNDSAVVKPGIRGRKKKQPLKRKYARKGAGDGDVNNKESGGNKKTTDIDANWKDLPSKYTGKKRGRKKKKVNEDEANNSDSSTSERADGNETSDSNQKSTTPSNPKKKPRIRISLTQNGSSANKAGEKILRSTKKSNKKRLRSSVDKITSSPNNDKETISDTREHSQNTDTIKKKSRDGELNSVDFEKIPKRKQRKDRSTHNDSSKVKHPDMDLEEGEINDEGDETIDEKVPSLSQTKNDVSTEEMDEDTNEKHLDLASINEAQSALDGSFTATRDFVLARGPWVLPKKVAQDKWLTVAKQTLTKMRRHDGYRLFAEKVTEEEAPGYSNVIKKPMDFGTMQEKLEDGSYGEGSTAISNLFQDFLLVFDNCALYNDKGSEVSDEAARVMSLLPEVFANVCLSVIEKKKSKRGRKRSRL